MMVARESVSRHLYRPDGGAPGVLSIHLSSRKTQRLGPHLSLSIEAILFRGIGCARQAAATIFDKMS